VQPLLELKTGWRFCTFGCSLSLDEQLILFLLQSLKKKNDFFGRKRWVGLLVLACLFVMVCHWMFLSIQLLKKKNVFGEETLNAIAGGLHIKVFLGSIFNFELGKLVCKVNK
jgi:hypothetical protein